MKIMMIVIMLSVALSACRREVPHVPMKSDYEADIYVK